MVQWVGLQCAIVVFPGHNSLLFNSNDILKVSICLHFKMKNVIAPSLLKRGDIIFGIPSFHPSILLFILPPTSSIG